MSKERRLGRGLAALLGEDNEPVSVSQTMGQPMTLRIHRPNEDDAEGGATREDHDSEDVAETVVRPVVSEAATAKDGDLLLLAVDQIDENPFQPRRDFSESELASLAESYEAVGIVVGLPVHQSGQEGGKAREARKFGAWAGRATGLPVRYFDERYSSLIAEQHLRGASLSPKKQKERLDKVAAQVFLQSYLDAADRTAPPAPLSIDKTEDATAAGSPRGAESG